MRTGNNGSTITFDVASGYVITGIKVEAYSNNTSTTADRSITLTSITVDDAAESVLGSEVSFPGGTAGSTPVTAEAKDFSAAKNVVLHFDNSLITTSDVDAAGKNKQIMAKITFTYAKATGIRQLATAPADAASPAIYDLSGRRTSVAGKGIYIIGDKKVVK